VAADRAKSALGVGSEDTIVVCSHEFDERGKARGGPYTTRELALIDAGTFIVLMPPTDAPLGDLSIGVQLGEYLQIRRQRKEAAKVACLHHPDVDPAEIVSQCAPDVITAVPGSEVSVRSLIGQIYPKQGHEALIRTMLTELLAAVGAGVVTERYTTAPTLTISMVQADLPLLDLGQIPPNAIVGGHRWERLFGRADGEAGLPWNVVRQNLQNPETWESVLAEELDFVRLEKRQRDVVPILLEERTGVSPMGAVCQKYEVYPSSGTAVNAEVSSNVHRFSLVAFHAPMLYDPTDNTPLADAFHLSVVAQLYRFLVIEHDMETLKSTLAMAPAKNKIRDFVQRVDSAISDLRRHTLLLDIESRRRNFMNRMGRFKELVHQAYRVKPGENAEADAKQARLSEIMPQGWLPLSESLEDGLKRGESGLADAISALSRIAELNGDVIKISANCYSRLTDIHY